jgi:glycosyltransferase involved in cell wall biosynthesis
MRDEAGPGAMFIPLRDRVVPAEYYRAVDLVLAPFRRDHSGRAVLPAWAASRPAAVLSGTVPAEFVVNDVNGWTVPPDPMELAAVIMRAFANPDQTNWMGKNGRVAAETAFNWEESAKRLLALYGMRERLTPTQ